MNRRLFLRRMMAAGAGILVLSRNVISRAQGLPSDPGGSGGGEVLPPFSKDGGVSLDTALSKRKSTRAYNPGKKLSSEEISRILWAADGVNRVEGRRTVFTASGRYPIDILAALPDGVFKYEPIGHKLTKILDPDIRAAIVGNPPAFKQAGMIVLFIMNKDKVAHGIIEYGDFEIGGMMQNIHLEAANLGLGACIFEGIDTETAKMLGLTGNQTIRIAQAVGVPN